MSEGNLISLFLCPHKKCFNKNNKNALIYFFLLNYKSKLFLMPFVKSANQVLLREQQYQQVTSICDTFPRMGLICLICFSMWTNSHLLYYSSFFVFLVLLIRKLLQELNHNKSFTRGFYRFGLWQQTNYTTGLGKSTGSPCSQVL